MPALPLQSEAGSMLANGFTVLCLLSSGGGVERSSGSLPGRPNVVSGVAGTCPRATPVSRRSAIGMAHKRSIRLQCISNRFASVVPTELSCSNRFAPTQSEPLVKLYGIRGHVVLLLTFVFEGGARSGSSPSASAQYISASFRHWRLCRRDFATAARRANFFAFAR